jgi:hypothetical protein
MQESNKYSRNRMFWAPLLLISGAAATIANTNTMQLVHQARTDAAALCDD